MSTKKQATTDVNVSFPMAHLKEARKRSAKLYAVARRTLGMSTRHDAQEVVWGELDPATEAFVEAAQAWLVQRTSDRLLALEDAVRQLRTD